jgi:hypothetical protein
VLIVSDVVLGICHIFCYRNSAMFIPDYVGVYIIYF